MNKNSENYREQAIAITEGMLNKSWSEIQQQEQELKQLKQDYKKKKKEYLKLQEKYLKLKEFIESQKENEKVLAEIDYYKRKYEKTNATINQLIEDGIISPDLKF